MTTPEESRTEVVSLRCTPTEKRAVRGVAAFREVSESELLRDFRMDEIVAEWARLTAAMGASAA